MLVPEFSQFGGAKTYFINLLHYYAKNQFEVHICLRKDQQTDDVMELVKKLGMTVETIHSRDEMGALINSHIRWAIDLYAKWIFKFLLVAFIIMAALTIFQKIMP